MKIIDEQLKLAKESVAYAQALTSEQKNEILTVCAEALNANKSRIINANKVDCLVAKECGKPTQFIDRLSLDEKRIDGICGGLTKLIALSDPINEVIDSWTTETGLSISKVRVPLGVIGCIYEARPNVTSDIFGLCIKSGNVAVLRGSKDAKNSNKEIVEILKEALRDNGYNDNILQLIEDVSHDGINYLMKQRKYIDVLIPRGGAGLINNVVNNSLIPVIETGTGNCHIYVEETADFNTALDIIENAKISRPSVCNACESVVVDKKIAPEFVKLLAERMEKDNVKVYGCEIAKELDNRIKTATEEDFYKEYLDYILSLKIVNSFDEAIEWINEHSTHHSESIISTDKKKQLDFLNRIDSAAVYVNCSTRWTDGEQFGFGAEIGISTQKIHARGPMGLKELCSYKYKVIGDGLIRK